MTITADIVARVRERSGAGIMECKKALQESKGDVEKALQLLREKGTIKALKKAGRQSSEGVIYSYIHAGGRLGVLLELNCETDFVARTDDFNKLALEIAMQIAAANPQWVSRKDVSADVIEKERTVYANQCRAEKKNEKIIPKIVDGKIDKFYGQICLLEQAHIRDSSGKTTVKSLIDAMVAKLGENIIVRRFIRYQVGGE